jgi:hypothetical protein
VVRVGVSRDDLAGTLGEAQRSTVRPLALRDRFNFEATSCRIPWMDPYRTPAEIIALTLLDRDGISAIWRLHLSAADAYRDGHRSVARGIIDIADAAEREWLRAKAAVKGSPG